MADQAAVKLSAGMRPAHTGVAVALLAACCLTACAPSGTHVLNTPEPTFTAAAPTPVMSDAEIAAPETWALLPGETAVRSWNGSGSEEIALPVDELSLVYAMYATCSGNTTLTVESTSDRDEEAVGSAWEVPCDSVPSRRLTYTDDTSRTTSLRLIIKGEGAWGLVLTNADTP